MKKSHSELIGMPVITEYSNSPIAFVKDIIIDPETGKILAFCVKKNQIIVPMDVQSINSALVISDIHRIVQIDEVLRVDEVKKLQISIINERVLAFRTKTYLGQVVDYVVSVNSMSLTAINIARTFLFFHFDERIIPYKNIVKINKDTIIVKNSNGNTVRTKESVRSSAFA